MRFKFCAIPGAVSVAVILSAGCVRLEPRPLSPSRIVEDFNRRTLSDPELRPFLERNLGRELPAWPLPSWDITNLVLAAYFYHPDLDVARARWAVTQAGRRIAGERPNPTVSVTPGYNTTTAIPSPWLVSAAFDIPIETAGKRGYRIAQATELSDAAKWNVASVASAVRGRVRQRFVELHGAREMEVLLKDQQSIQAENLRLLESQFQAGAISAFELAQARITADGTTLAARDAERQSAEALVQLADAVGVPAGAMDQVPISFPDWAGSPPDIPDAEARRRALLGRADIWGALAEYAASESELQLEIARQYPDVHLSPGYEFDQGANKWALGLSVTLPVLNQNRGAIAEAAAKRAEAAAAFNALQFRVIGEAERAVAGYRVAIRKVADTEAMGSHLAQQEKAAEAMLAAGEITRLEVLALRLQLSASALARAEARLKAHQAAGLLEDALQATVSAAAWESPARTSDTNILPVLR